MIAISEKDGGLTFSVRVLPRASRSEIAGEADGALKIRISTPPVDGAANTELVRLLAKFLGIAKRDIEIVSGLSSRSKRINVSGIDLGRLKKAFESLG